MHAELPGLTAQDGSFCWRDLVSRISAGSGVRPIRFVFGPGSPCAKTTDIDAADKIIVARSNDKTRPPQVALACCNLDCIFPLLRRADRIQVLMRRICPFIGLLYFCAIKYRSSGFESRQFIDCTRAIDCRTSASQVHYNSLIKASLQSVALDLWSSLSDRERP